ncbi:Type IV fimbrial assembly protein PilC [hydrothermal vent metagenome]|uniref:Type IV fimbrial assembly protein PilC n=1 Tax=hydrothermal vent metagenome TaxID=652676 RepID=A0A3B1DYJ6_9ZZZZ
MAQFKVKTKDNGSKKTIIVNAENKIQAMSIVEKEYGIIPIDAKVLDKKHISISSIKKYKKLKFRDVLYIFQEIHILIVSGISLKDAISEVLKTSEQDYVQSALSKIISGLNKGKTFSSLMAEHYDKQSIVISILKVGEKGGDLNKILDVIITYLEDADKNISSVVKALSYPFILVIFTIMAFVLLLSFVVPQFADIFKSFGHDLPIYTKILIRTSEFIREYGVYIFLGLVSSLVLFFYRYKTNKIFKLSIDTILMTKIYILSTTLKLNAMYKITSSLEILLYAGINVVDSLNMILESTTNEYIREKLKQSIVHIKNGKTLANALREGGLFKSSTIRLIFAGENVGQTPEMIKRVAQIYRRDLNNYIGLISKLVEPFLLIFISAMVLFIALSIFMPIWSLSSGI